MNIEIDKLFIGIASIVGAVSGLYSLWRGRKKDKAETKKIEVETDKEKADLATTYENMAGRQADQIDKLKLRVDELEDEVKCLTEWIEALVLQLRKANITPSSKPKRQHLENSTKAV